MQIDICFRVLKDPTVFHLPKLRGGIRLKGRDDDRTRRAEVWKRKVKGITVFKEQPPDLDHYYQEETQDYSSSEQTGSFKE